MKSTLIKLRNLSVLMVVFYVKVSEEEKCLKISKLWDSYGPCFDISVGCLAL